MSLVFTRDSIFSQINPATPEFYYCTIGDLREIGIPAPPPDAVGFVSGTVNDKRLQKFIVLISNRINAFTNQFYQPWTKSERTNGTGQTVIYTLQLDKMIEIESVAFVDAETIFDYIDSFLYVIKERFVAKSTTFDSMNLVDRVRFWNLPHGFKFVRGNNNWLMTGTFGDIKILHKIETFLLTTIAFGDTTIEVDDATGIREGDSVSIGEQSFIANKVLGTSEIEIDPSLVDIELTSPGNKVIRFGRIHDDIRNAAIRLVVDELIGPDSLTNVGTGAVRSEIDNRCDFLISEKTDNYSYTKGKRTVRERADESLLNDGTGNVKVDSILRQYLAPPYGEFV